MPLSQNETIWGRLEKEGLLRSEIEGRQRYYSINPQYPHLKAVLSLLQGTVGIVPTLTSALHRVEGIEQAYLCGSFAKGVHCPTTSAVRSKKSALCMGFCTSPLTGSHISLNPEVFTSERYQIP